MTPIRMRLIRIFDVSRSVLANESLVQSTASRKAVSCDRTTGRWRVSQSSVGKFVNSSTPSAVTK